MELRVLRYFLTVAQQGSITAAARVLHLTQPTLSRQIRDLEIELGQTLFVRHSHSLTLTVEGTLLRQRAEEILTLVEKTEGEFKSLQDAVEGDVYFGAAETRGMASVGRAFAAMHARHPDVRLHLYSGNAEDLCDRLDQGVLDFALLSQPVNLGKYERIELPRANYWVAYVRDDDPLAGQDYVTNADLAGRPLIVSRQSMRPVPGNAFLEWFGPHVGEVRAVADFNLPFNAAIMAQQGLGVLVTWDGLVDCGPGSGLVGLPLEPRVESALAVAWRRSVIPSRAAATFLRFLEEGLGSEDEG